MRGENKLIILLVLMSFIALVGVFGLVQAKNGNDNEMGNENSGNDAIEADCSVDEDCGQVQTCGMTWECDDGTCRQLSKECPREDDSGEEDEDMEREEDHNRTRIQLHNRTMDCDECNVSEEPDQEGNQTRYRVHFSNGKNAEVKIMPETASERALERLRLKVCNQTVNNCTIELKEVGGDKEGNETRAAYEIQIQRHFKLLGLFKTKAQVMTQVDAENGEVLRVKKPWWAFISTEPEETNEEQ